jgi:hypothetical protein
MMLSAATTTDAMIPKAATHKERGRRKGLVGSIKLGKKTTTMPSSSSDCVTSADNLSLETPDFKRQRHTNFTPGKDNEELPPLSSSKRLNLAPPNAGIRDWYFR